MRMKNVVAVVFEEESSTYEVLSALKTREGTSSVLTASVVKHANGEIIVEDGYTIDNDSDNWALGGLIGGLIGILGGPIGILLYGSVGALVGSAVDSENIENTGSVLNEVATHLGKNKTALLLIADEHSENELNQFFAVYHPLRVVREPYLTVQTDVYQAEELQEELAREAKRKIKEEKKDKWKDKAQQKQKELEDKFNQIKEKLSKEG